MGGNRIKTWRSNRRKKIPVYRRMLLCGADSSCRPRGALDIIFVDRRHLFDFALTDFTVSGELCSMGGHIILEDMWLPSIQRVVAFIRENREDFTEVETPVGNIGVFRRTGADDGSSSILWNCDVTDSRHTSDIIGTREFGHRRTSLLPFIHRLCLITV
jgi:hypothetical protein